MAFCESLQSRIWGCAAQSVDMQLMYYTLHYYFFPFCSTEVFSRLTYNLMSLL